MREVNCTATEYQKRWEYPGQNLAVCSLQSRNTLKLIAFLVRAPQVGEREFTRVVLDIVMEKPQFASIWMFPLESCNGMGSHTLSLRVSHSRAPGVRSHRRPRVRIFSFSRSFEIPLDQ